MTQEPKSRPNIIVILADDMGFSDLGCYGSEIATPNLDSLAAGGLRFSQMYNSARCCPSRAALLTGLNPQQTGVGHMVADLGMPAYQGYLNESCVTIAEVLGSQGYTTLMTGKWHVGGGYDLMDPASWTPGATTHPTPTQRGFDRFFGIVAGAANYFSPLTLMRDDTLIDLDTLGDDFYLTDAISDNAAQMIDDAAEDDRPFFLHVTYTAPHWPLHAPEEEIAKYKGKYRQGWDTLRTNRHEELKGMKILDSKWEISPRHEDSPDWGDVPNRDWEDLRMAVYAAMIDRVDQGIGRILARLREREMLEHTLIMFLADNGGCAEFLAEDGPAVPPSRYAMPLRDGRQMKVGNDPELRPGPADTFMSYDMPWANASNTPFRLFKRWVHEGGISTPLIVSWSGRINEARIVHQPTHLIDISATCIDAAGASYPSEFNGHQITPIEGESFLPLIERGEWTRERPIFWEHEGSRAMRAENWKLVSEIEGEWELYDMDEDRTELNNLAERNRSQADRMIQSYDDWTRRIGVLPFPVDPAQWSPGFNRSHAHVSR